MSKTQEAIQIIPGEQDFYSWRRVKTPQLRPGAVILKILRCGECNTALAVASGKYGKAASGKKYLTLGHEILGEIVRIADDVSGFEIGQRAMVQVRIPKPDAFINARVAPNLTSDCTQWQEHGLYELDGGYVREMVVDAKYLHPVPEHMSDNMAVLSEGAVCVYTAAQTGIKMLNARVGEFYTPDRKVLVLGARPAGLMATLFYRHLGFEVVVVSLEPEKHENALRIKQTGASYIQNSNDDDFKDHIVKEYGPFPYIFDGSGAAQCMLWSSKVSDAGMFVNYSIPEKDFATKVNLTDMVISQVTGSRCSIGSINCNPANWDRAYQMLIWAGHEFPNIFDEIFEEIPFESGAEQAVIEAVKDGCFKPMVVMSQ